MLCYFYWVMSYTADSVCLIEEKDRNVQSCRTKLAIIMNYVIYFIIQLLRSLILYIFILTHYLDGRFPCFTEKKAKMHTRTCDASKQTNNSCCCLHHCAITRHLVAASEWQLLTAHCFSHTFGGCQKEQSDVLRRFNFCTNILLNMIILAKSYLISEIRIVVFILRSLNLRGRDTLARCYRKNGSTSS